MTAFRAHLLLGLLLGLLAACDDKPAPPPDPLPYPPKAPEVQAPSPGQPQADTPAAPAQATAKPAEAAAKQTPQVLPALGSQVVKDTSLPKPAENKPKPAAKVPTDKPLPAVKLDLHLPPGMVEQLQLDEPLAVDLSTQPLLPEMFVKKPTEPGPFELNGRLITNDHSEDYWESVEGAELQFKFRN